MIVNFFVSHEAYKVLENQDDETRNKVFPLRLPTLARFAVSIGTYPQVVSKWANAKDENGDFVYPDFHVSYRQAMAMQETLIIEGSIVGAYNANMAKTLLYHHHGYEDKKTVQIEAVQSKRLAEYFDGLVESVLERSSDKEQVIDRRFERITRNEV